jgi:hypothetical protein
LLLLIDPAFSWAKDVVMDADPNADSISADTISIYNALLALLDK